MRWVRTLLKFAFQQNYELALGEGKAKGEKPYGCQTCRERFNQKLSLLIMNYRKNSNQQLSASSSPLRTNLATHHRLLMMLLHNLRWRRCLLDVRMLRLLLRLLSSNLRCRDSDQISLLQIHVVIYAWRRIRRLLWHGCRLRAIRDLLLLGSRGNNSA